MILQRRKVFIIAAICVIVLMLVVTLVIVTPKKSFISKKSQEQSVLLISLDGFRFDYLQRGFSPNLLKFAKSGVQAEFLQSQFPTKTFPNHYTIVTGLYPESHGIVENTFYDNVFNETFSLGLQSKFDPKWWNGEPIWVTAKKQGYKSASFFWPGSDVQSEEKIPNYWKMYNRSVPYLERIDQVISWLKLDDKSRPSITLMYFEEPDSAGHIYGPDSEQVNSAIKKTDEYFGILLEKLKSNKLTENLNIIVVSDHGMAAENTSAIIYIDQILGGLKGMSVLGRNAASMIYSDTPQNISISCNKNALVMKKYDYSIPARMHFSNNRRIGDIIISPKNPWVLQISNLSSPFNDKGYHGLDNIISEMQAIFLASGPAFKSGFVSAPFANIEIYNLLASILKLKPAPNNGTIGSLDHLLLQHSSTKYSSINKRAHTFRFFPKDANASKVLCKSCICPYCSKNILNNIALFESNLNLSKEELITSQIKHFPYSLPSGGNDVCILTQRSYITGYSPKLRIPLWVGYQLHGKDLLINIKRSNCFRQDIRLESNESSFCSSYSNSGFDRGHLAPSGDFNHNVDDEQDSNVLSNIAPQYPNFNRGIWQTLEDLVRNWTKNYGNLHVISGSIFDVDNNGIKDELNQTKRFLKNEINGTAIPTHFYKILYKCPKSNDNGLCDTELDTLSFVLPHNNATICTTELEYIKMHVASIRDIELMTGALFFADLPSDYRARLVSRLQKKLW